MVLLLVAFLGGMLTILSPCILPVLPFVFARAEQPFLKNGLPLLGGMILTFTAVATLAAVGGTWAVQLNQYGRVLALLLLAFFALALLSDRVATALARPFVALGNRLLPAGEDGGVWRSVVMGAATGLLWAPCAGPILGLILTGAVISGPGVGTSLLLLSYSAGAALSLALALLAGARVLALLRGTLGAGEWVRRGLGVAVLFAVVAITLGWDTGILTRLSLDSTNRVEQALLDRLNPELAVAGSALAVEEESAALQMTGGPAMMAGTEAMQGGGAMMAGGNAMTGGNAMMMAGGAAGGLPVEGQLPPLDGATSWLNSAPLTPDALRGKVVLIDFWTYSCINCLRALPYVQAWQEKYRDHGFVVIGVHAPEFAFEKSERNVSRAVRDLGIDYPVALDNDYAIWRAFNNRYWPAHYFVDATGSIRAHHFGEGGYAESEQIIRRLLAEAGSANLPGEAAAVPAAEGVQAAADLLNMQSPETYIGHERAESFISPGGFAPDVAKTYEAPEQPGLNQWGLAGDWSVDAEKGVLNAPQGRIVFRFLARDLHLVLAPAAAGQPVRFRVLLDGEAPAAQNRGLDLDAEGSGVVNEERLYQLIRQQGDVQEHTFTIEFLDSGVQAYSFTFG